ncbi:hypothetical protein BDFB_010704, partial [Asbolus verrucosus]
IITDFTRFRLTQNPSLIDLLMTSDPDLISSVEIADHVGISDHVHRMTVSLTIWTFMSTGIISLLHYINTLIKVSIFILTAESETNLGSVIIF